MADTIVVQTTNTKVVLSNTSYAGKVTGPSTATDNAVARYDGTTGKIIQNSAVTIDDSGNIATSGTVDGRDVSADGATLDAIDTGGSVQTFAQGNITNESDVNAGTKMVSVERTGVGTKTLNLPAASAVTTTSLTIRHYDNGGGSGTVTLTPDGLDTIDGASTYNVPLGQTITLISNGSSDWKMVHPSADWANLPAGWLDADWALQGGGAGDWHPLQYRVLTDGTTVQFRGAIGSTGVITGSTLFTLPAKLRPYSDTLMHGLNGSLGFEAIGINPTTGVVRLESGTPSHQAYVNFDGAWYSITTAP